MKATEAKKFPLQQREVRNDETEKENSMDAFAGADICIINKIDLLPYVDSDVARLKDNALKINPQLCFFEISATRGMGMDEWCEYLLACFERKEEK